LEKIKIRKAVRKDSKSIIKLILELADFEKLLPPDKSARKRLLKDAFSKKQLFKILLAEIDSQAIGYAFYFFTYSSFKARRTLYLEDIFIAENFRNRGIGKLFFTELIKIAKKNKCRGMEWIVLDWNSNAIKFYDKLGAKELKEWKTYRINL
jgi:GNAT superfamily N-acetyltransferase